MLNSVRRIVPLAAFAVAAAAVVPASASADAPGDQVGSLIQFPSPNDCITENSTDTCGTNLSGGFGNATGVAISPNGKSAYVASKNGALSTLKRNTNGTLTFERCIKDLGSSEACGANSPHLGDLAGAQSVDVSPNGDFVYVAASTSTTDAITAFARDASTGALTPLPGTGPDTAVDQCISEEISGCRQAVGLKGVKFLRVSDNSVYAVSPSQSTLVRLKRDPASGRVTQESATADCFRGTSATTLTCGVSTLPAGANPGLNGPTSLALTTLDGKSVYVASKASSALTTFNRTPADGKITFAACTGGTESSDCPTRRRAGSTARRASRRPTATSTSRRALGRGPTRATRSSTSRATRPRACSGRKASAIASRHPQARPRIAPPPRPVSAAS